MNPHILLNYTPTGGHYSYKNIVQLNKHHLKSGFKI